MYTKNDLNKIIGARDIFEPTNILWSKLNYIKAEVLEEIKPSTSETIFFYRQKDLEYIPEGFYKTDELPSSKPKIYLRKRSQLEYSGVLYRHPIPYIILKYQDKYFFILREKGSGEIRLEGMKGLVGGHVGAEGIEKGMYRELEEEVGVTVNMIDHLELKGLIKSNKGVDIDHLGCIYEIELNTDKIKAEEDGVLSGLWINKENLFKHYNSFENWSKIVYDNILKFE